MAKSASESTVELVPVDADIARLAEVFAGMSEVEVAPVDPQQVVRDIMTQILSSETEEELWGELPTWSSKDSVGLEFELQGGGNIYPSKYEDKDTGRKGAFLSAKAVRLDTGEVGVLNTSAVRIAAKVLWLARHDALPAKIRIVKRGESASGYDILDCERLDEAPF